MDAAAIAVVLLEGRTAKYTWRTDSSPMWMWEERREVLSRSVLARLIVKPARLRVRKRCSSAAAPADPGRHCSPVTDHEPL